jgi:hypothetical protein
MVRHRLRYTLRRLYFLLDEKAETVKKTALLVLLIPLTLFEVYLCTAWVTQMLRQSDAQVFKKYSQMKLQMKREALGKLNRRANEIAPVAAEVLLAAPMCTVRCSNPIRAQSGLKRRDWSRDESAKSFAIRERVGGRDRDRTADPLLAKQAEMHSKSLLWLRFQISDPVKCVPKMFLPVVYQVRRSVWSGSLFILEKRQRPFLQIEEHVGVSVGLPQIVRLDAMLPESSRFALA